MTTQNDTIPVKNEGKFDARQYGTLMVILGISYVAMLVAIAFWTMVLSDDLLALIQRIFFTTLFYLVPAVIVTIVTKPTYVKQFAFKPIYLAGIATLAAGLTVWVWLYRKQAAEEGRLQLVLLVMLAALILFGTRKLTSAWFEVEEKSGHLIRLAHILIVAGAVAGTLLIPHVLESKGTVVQLWTDLLIVLCGIALLGGVWVLDKLTTADVKSTSIPDGYAGVVRAKGRIQRIGFGKSVDVKVKGEEFEKHDMRLQTTHMDINDCLTADHAYMDVEAVVEWQLIDTVDGLTAFFTVAANPLESLKAACSSTMRSEIGQRDSRFISGRESAIADKVTKLVAHAENQHGVRHARVIIVHARLKYLMPGEGISPLAEANRLRTMDSAVRSAAKTTVKHAESMANAEASARAGAEKDEQGKDDRPRSH